MSAMYDQAMERLEEILDGIDLGAPAVEPKVKEMLITKAAVTTATEEGVFTAVISTERTDREGDVVIPEAMVAAIQAWNVDGKQIPLAWAHRTEPDELIGSVDPTSVKAQNGEVIVSAWIDRDTPRGQQVWRLVKSQTLGFSFGYLVTDSVKRPNGDREIRGLDIFEISATATPMNRGTRVLDWKSTEQPEPEPEVPTPEELRARSDALERELGLEDPEITALRDQTRQLVANAMGHTTDDTKTLTPAQLRAKSERIAAEFAPIQIATFAA
jgi:HK97 family phage prohead protease